jgi:hypothetical protein
METAIFIAEIALYLTILIVSTKWLILSQDMVKSYKEKSIRIRFSIKLLWCRISCRPLKWKNNCDLKDPLPKECGGLVQLKQGRKFKLHWRRSIVAEGARLPLESSRETAEKCRGYDNLPRWLGTSQLYPSTAGVPASPWAVRRVLEALEDRSLVLFPGQPRPQLIGQLRPSLLQPNHPRAHLYLPVRDE